MSVKENEKKSDLLCISPYFGPVYSLLELVLTVLCLAEISVCICSKRSVNGSLNIWITVNKFIQSSLALN